MQITNNKKGNPVLRVLMTVLSRGMLKSTQKAFIFAYLYIVIPSIIKKIRYGIKKKNTDNIPSNILKSIYRGLHPLGFPILVAKMVSITNILGPFLEKYLVKKNNKGSYISTLIASFIGAMVNFPSFQSYVLKFGRSYSLDFTLILVTRALDTVISSMVASESTGYFAGTGDAALFTIFCYFIMRAWFYFPEKLPPAYAKWITAAAAMEDDLRPGLKAFKNRVLRYGESGPHSEAFIPICRRNGKDLKYCDLVEQDVLPCEVVHGFLTKSCELNAIMRFFKGFKFASKLYGTLNVILWLIKRGSPMKYVINTIRSSAFLGMFIFLDYYFVCLGRNKIFPALFPKKSQEFHERLAPELGSIMCGLSCFIENFQRRKELSLFVAPKALGTLVPSNESKANLTIECFAFSLSFAVLATFSKINPKAVRGIMGKGLGAVLSDK